MIIDTPGMRELGIWNAGEGVSEVFEDLEEYAKQCRFTDCTHSQEPGCAVQKAIQNGDLSEKRLIRYKKLLRETRHAEQTAAVRWHKSITQTNKKKKSGGTRDSARRLERSYED